MMDTLSNTLTLVPPRQDISSIKELKELISSNASQDTFLQSGEQVVKIPKSLYEPLLQLLRAMESERPIFLIPSDHQMTTQEAADFLNVSRPYLIKLLEQGHIPYTRVGKHRRVSAKSVMEYKEQRDVERSHNLEALLAFHEEEGFYD